MTVYSFFVFDRHTECIYQRRWTPPPTQTPKRPASTASTSTAPTSHALPGSAVSSPPQSATTSRPQSRSQQSRPQSSSSTPAPTTTSTTAPPTTAAAAANTSNGSEPPHTQYPTSGVTPKAANEAKLLFGVIFSLRNLTRQLGGTLNSHTPATTTGPSPSATSTAASASNSNLTATATTTTTTTTGSTTNDSSAPAANASGSSSSSAPAAPHPSGGYDEFLSYTTAEYKLHYFETATSLKFCMMTDPRTANLRVVLHQIWANLWVEYVVRNPLAPAEHGSRREVGRDGNLGGVGNELFEMGLDRFVAQVVNPV